MDTLLKFNILTRSRLPHSSADLILIPLCLKQLYQTARAALTPQHQRVPPGGVGGAGDVYPPSVRIQLSPAGLGGRGTTPSPPTRPRRGAAPERGAPPPAGPGARDSLLPPLPRARQGPDGCGPTAALRWLRGRGRAPARGTGARSALRRCVTGGPRKAATGMRGARHSTFPARPPPHTHPLNGR